MENIFNPRMEKLISVIQKLSMSHTIKEIREIVKHTARELVGSDGATFVLKENNLSYYLDEDAIAPLWKGKKFPIESCISGWSMLNKKSVVIEDIYKDSRIPKDAYRPTFVKSLVMVPIRTVDPIGAIGNYWKEKHVPSPEDVKLLEALADSTSIAMENAKLYEELEDKVLERTIQLEAANKELEAFSYSVSHDLRAPLNRIIGFNNILLKDYADKLNTKGKDLLSRISKNVTNMQSLITELIKLSKINRSELHKIEVNISQICREILNELSRNHEKKHFDFIVADDLIAKGDSKLIHIALENLLSNACKFTKNNPKALIEVGLIHDNNKKIFFVRDNGSGFDMNYADKLFAPFQRLHKDSEFPGIGIGLATVQRIINLHGGKIWAESVINQGTTFYFTFG